MAAPSGSTPRAFTTSAGVTNGLPDDANPGSADEEARARGVEATLARQKAILGERKPDIHVVIGETALRQEVGGPTVMEGQLGLLAEVSGDSGTITVQILPFSSGAHAAANISSMTILQFPEIPGLGIVHLGGAGGGVCLENPAELAATHAHLSSCGRSRSARRSPRSCCDG